MAKRAAKKGEEAEPLKLFYVFYSRERWDNWITSLQEAGFDFDPKSDEMPEGFKVLYGFGLDITLEVLKIIKLFQNGRFPKEEALNRLSDVEAIVMAQPPEDALEEVIESLQLSMLVLFASCRSFIEGGYEGDLKALVKDGRTAIDEDMEKALGIAARIGANVINGAACCSKFVKEDMEAPTLFDEWLIEAETMSEAMGSLKNFDEVAGEDY
jgi:hypothetical protein